MLKLDDSGKPTIVKGNHWILDEVLNRKEMILGAPYPIPDILIMLYDITKEEIEEYMKWEADYYKEYGQVPHYTDALRILLKNRAYREAQETIAEGGEKTAGESSQERSDSD